MAMLSTLGLMSKYQQLKLEIGEVTIVVASKYMSIDEVNKLYSEGARDFGENRSDELLYKKAYTKKDITWHFIGHLQSNKVKQVINEIDYLHSLDRLSLAKAIQKHRTTPLNCFIQVNVAKESQKSGILLENLKEFMNSLSKYDKIRVVGFMAMGVLNDQNQTKHVFKTLSSIKGDYKLSMGMSGDYKLALNYQTDYIRIGSLLKE